jgi:Ca2+:H+ antiporter
MMRSFVRREGPMLAGAVTLLLLFGLGAERLVNVTDPIRALLVFAWLFVVILWAEFGVMRHADHLAHQLGEPLGTLILTLSAISIEVSLIAALIFHGDANPTLARDTMFAVLMIILNTGWSGLLFWSVRYVIVYRTLTLKGLARSWRW